MDLAVTQPAVAARAIAAPSGMPGRGIGSGATPITVVMPTTDFGQPFERCARRVLELLRTDRRDELLVVLDGEWTRPPAWLGESDATILVTGRRSGPAAARNLAAGSARGDVLLFVDADVELARDTLERVRAAFDEDPDLCGVFGAYDDAPSAPGLVSRFRNLLHHHTHVSHAGPAESFWAGCGAMRVAAFQDLGGFDARFREPSIEDIELGSRAFASGGRLRLDPLIACTHHKRWTLWSMIHTDIVRRAVPWTRHMITTGSVPRGLNLDWRSRTSGVCALLAGIALLAAPVWPRALLPAIACLVAMVAMNRRFYGLCSRRGGPVFAAGCFLLHWLYYAYATLTFAAVMASQPFFPACSPAGSDERGAGGRP